MSDSKDNREVREEQPSRQKPTVIPLSDQINERERGLSLEAPDAPPPPPPKKDSSDKSEK